ncbi:uncharacterized protein LOC107965473 [Apis mellifera]|uniref:Uncharacterized protein LOC107965473 n=1 Tax=Apis mellifera TaxID=7460 RepID=A0A7M7IK51_APIME|nr:uncharacterized protein LOC107965473 [Apis mellifera]|eukprot:XP_016771509.1 uncharacterized protein LOC107965473 [Apis mellifera]
MIINKLCAAFRQISINTKSNIIVKYYSSYLLKEYNNAISLPNFSTNALNIISPNIKFIPKTLNIDFENSRNNIKKDEMPLSKYIPSMEEPLINQSIKQDLPLIDTSFQLPPTENILEKLAIRMIVIRRKKMKKHKRRKLRKKMKFKWAKIRANRNVLKEKLFQAELVTQIKEAHNFDPKKYIEGRLAILDKEILPKTYRGEILSPEMIKKFIDEKKEYVRKKRNKIRLSKILD